MKIRLCLNRMLATLIMVWLPLACLEMPNRAPDEGESTLDSRLAGDGAGDQSLPSTPSTGGCDESDEAQRMGGACAEDFGSIDDVSVDIEGLDPVDDLGGLDPVDDLGGLDPVDDLGGLDPVDDLCNAMDDDGDGVIDERTFERPTSLQITFKPTTAVDPTLGRIHIRDHIGQEIEGSPFSGDSLAGATVTVPGNLFYIQIIVEEGGLATRGYEIERITDELGHLAPTPYPSVPRDDEGRITVPIDHESWFDMGDSQGAGRRCGETDRGACEYGLLVCLAGDLVCTMAIDAADESCNSIDDDCDGQIDEAQDLSNIAPLCEKQLGVCEGSRASCVDGEWGGCLFNYGDDYMPDETRCDCLDNDCDGVIDARGDELLGCTFMDLAPHGI
jgi:hypothetical protein